MSKKSNPYPSDVSDEEEWEFCAPYLTLVKEQPPQRTHQLAAGVQRIAVAGACGLFLADDASGVSALVGCAATNTALVAGRVFGGDGA